ncbi:arsenate reductase (glutaredoxin) [Janthinobacterium sp. RT4P48]|uniref:arsenate reductase (glutaredoxin) n=1 Tax=Janthinobacterium sp. RT4P48 TaxID=3424188 RepID=UPI003F1E9A1A
MSVTIYHNPDCATSRNTLGLIRNAGIEPYIIEYLKHPPDAARLIDLIVKAERTIYSVVRQKGTPFVELGLDSPTITNQALIEAMVAHPILINRPFVVTSLGVRLCRPSELVLDILPQPQRGAFAKEDGERVINEHGERIKHG